MNWTGRLTDDNAERALRVAIDQVRESEAYGAAHRHGLKGDGFMETWHGRRAEAFVAQVYDVPWNPTTMANREREDVEGVGDVRHTIRPNGRLILHPEDPNDRPALLVTGEAVLTIHGWLYGREGKSPEWWVETYRAPCYMVPQRHLHPPDTLSVMRPVQG